MLTIHSRSIQSPVASLLSQLLLWKEGCHILNIALWLLASQARAVKQIVKVKLIKSNY